MQAVCEIQICSEQNQVKPATQGFSFYCKLKTSAVKPGDKVKTGQVLGVVDTINGETQLHFQIWQKQKPQNPEVWLRKR